MDSYTENMIKFTNHKNELEKYRDKLEDDKNKLESEMDSIFLIINGPDFKAGPDYLVLYKKIMATLKTNMEEIVKLDNAIVIQNNLIMECIALIMEEMNKKKDNMILIDSNKYDRQNYNIVNKKGGKSNKRNSKKSKSKNSKKSKSKNSKKSKSKNSKKGKSKNSKKVNLKILKK